MGNPGSAHRTAVMSAPSLVAWLLVVLLQLDLSLTATSISSSSFISSSSSDPRDSSRDALLWRADAANSQGPHYRQFLTSPVKLLGGGVPVPATPSQKIALASGFQPHTNHNPWGTPAQRFTGARRQDVPLGPDQDVEVGARVRQQQA